MCGVSGNNDDHILRPLAMSLVNGGWVLILLVFIARHYAEYDTAAAFLSVCMFVTHIVNHTNALWQPLHSRFPTLCSSSTEALSTGGQVEYEHFVIFDHYLAISHTQYWTLIRSHMRLVEPCTCHFQWPWLTFKSLIFLERWQLPSTLMDL